jgi:hypothetical protein
MTLIHRLHDAKLVHSHTDPEVRKEIELRKRQYPDQKIYLMMGYDLANYYSSTLGEAYLNQAIMIELYSSSRPNEYQIGSYQSAVVAEKQIRANHSLHYHYEINKIPYWWELAWWMYMKLAIEVEPRVDSKEVIQEGSVHSRFGTLEI